MGLFSLEIFGQPPTLCEQYDNLNFVNTIGSPNTTTYTSNIPSSLLDINGNLSGKNIEIFGTLEVNTSNFKIEFCILKMNPSSQIYIPNGEFLTVETTDLFACNEMWKGIRLDSGGGLRFVNNDIEDAEYAIFAGNKITSSTPLPLYLVIGDNKFNRNHVGVYVLNTTVNSTHNYYSNEFKCTSSLNAPYTGQGTTLNPNYSFAGMWFKKHPSAILQGQSSNNNSFDNQLIGIIADESFVLINETVFTNMIDDGIYTGYPYLAVPPYSLETGIGIYAINSSMIFQSGFGGTSSDPFSFKDCGNLGIFCLESVLEAENNAMTSASIYTYSMTNYSLIINDNYMNGAINSSGAFFSNDTYITARHSQIANTYVTNNEIDATVNDNGRINLLGGNLNSGTTFYFTNNDPLKGLRLDVFWF